MAAGTQRGGSRWTHVSTRMLYLVLGVLMASALIAGAWIARRSSGADPFHADRVPLPSTTRSLDAGDLGRPLTAEERRRCLATLDMRVNARTEARQLCRRLLATPAPR